MASFEHRLPADTDQAALIALVDQLNADPAVDGILFQLPLPGYIDEQAVMPRINPDKDVDGSHPVNPGRLAPGMPGCAVHPAGVHDPPEGPSATSRGKRHRDGPLEHGG